jgi:hypothetical protein
VGLSYAARRGCGAHAAAGGPAVSARYRWRDAGVSAARFGGRGGGEEEGCTLLQVDGAPVRGLSLGLAAVVGGGGGGGSGGRGRAPPAPLARAPSAAAAAAASSDWQSDETSAGPGDHAHHHHTHHHARPRARLAALACCADVFGGGSGGGGGPATSLSGWVAADVGSGAAASPPVAHRSWGATLVCPPDRAAPGGLGWALTLAGGGGSGGSGGSGGGGHPLLAEAGLTVPLGSSGASGGGPAGAVFPAVLLVRGRGGRSAALVGVRSSWGF